MELDHSTDAEKPPEDESTVSDVKTSAAEDSVAVEVDRPEQPQEIDSQSTPDAVSDLSAFSDVDSDNYDSGTDSPENSVEASDKSFAVGRDMTLRDIMQACAFAQSENRGLQFANKRDVIINVLPNDKEITPSEIENVLGGKSAVGSACVENATPTSEKKASNSCLADDVVESTIGFVVKQRQELSVSEFNQVVEFLLTRFSNGFASRRLVSGVDDKSIELEPTPLERWRADRAACIERAGLIASKSDSGIRVFSVPSVAPKVESIEREVPEKGSDFSEVYAADQNRPEQIRQAVLAGEAPVWLLEANLLFHESARIRWFTLELLTREAEVDPRLFGDRLLKCLLNSATQESESSIAEVKWISEVLNVLYKRELLRSGVLELIKQMAERASAQGIAEVAKKSQQIPLHLRAEMLFGALNRFDRKSFQDTHKAIAKRQLFAFVCSELLSPEKPESLAWWDEAVAAAEQVGSQSIMRLCIVVSLLTILFPFVESYTFTVAVDGFVSQRQLDWLLSDVFGATVRRRVLSRKRRLVYEQQENWMLALVLDVYRTDKRNSLEVDDNILREWKNSIASIETRAGWLKPVRGANNSIRVGVGLLMLSEWMCWSDGQKTKNQGGVAIPNFASGLLCDCDVPTARTCLRELCGKLDQFISSIQHDRKIPFESGPVISVGNLSRPERLRLASILAERRKCLKSLSKKLQQLLQSKS